MRVIGLDVGGANLKASDGERVSRSLPFAMWRESARLSDALKELLAGFGPCDAIAATMTGELADCFASKRDGVARIVRALQQAAGGTPVHVWQTGGEFTAANEADDLATLVASANWHALATWGARMVPRGNAFLMDIGSTTTDLIPLRDGRPEPIGHTDLERLQSGELLYTGVRRTPVCAVLSAVPFRGRSCPVAAELFATTLDAYLLLGERPEAEKDDDTADGRPATRAFAHARLARMLCADANDVTPEETRLIAETIVRRQAAAIRESLQRIGARTSGECHALLCCGEGEMLARRVIRETWVPASAEIVSLHSALGEEHSQAACAYALARLGAERLVR